MSLESDIIDHLLADSTITNVVGTRIYHAGEAKADLDLPYVTIRRISTLPEEVSAGESGLVNALVQVDCYEETTEEAKTLANLVRLSIAGTRPPAGLAGTTIRTIIRTGEADDFDLPEDGGYRTVPRVVQTYSCWLTESTS